MLYIFHFSLIIFNDKISIIHFPLSNYQILRYLFSSLHFSLSIFHYQICRPRALGQSLRLGPYFTIYPSSRPNTDTICPHRYSDNMKMYLTLLVIGLVDIWWKYGFDPLVHYNQVCIWYHFCTFFWNLDLLRGSLIWDYIANFFILY